MSAALGVSRPPATLFRPTSTFTGATLRGWYRADTGLYQLSDGTVAVSADTDPVGYWEDLSGNGNHLTQATSGSRPLYRTGIWKSRAMVLFDGVVSHLIADGLAAYLTDIDSPFTILTVFLPGTQSGPKAVVSAGRSFSTTAFLECLRSSGTLSADRRDDANLLVTATSTGNDLRPTAANIGSWRFTGTQIEIQANSSAAITSDLDTGAITLDKFTVGARRRGPSTIDAHALLYLGELLVVEGAMDARERKLLRQYLKGAWNVGGA